MNRLIYIISITAALIIFIFFYLIEFNNMSETELVDKVLYWYAPLVFGVFGLFGLRLKSSMGEDEKSAVAFLFSGKDKQLTTWTIILIFATALIGVLLFFIPLSLIKPKTRNYDLILAMTGTLFWLGALWFFFVAIWPSL